MCIDVVEVRTTPPVDGLKGMSPYYHKKHNCECIGLESEAVAFLLC